MSEQEKAPERKRRDWIIILIILLIGFLCVILAGGWAIRFAPTWRMDTDMGSNIDPDSVFLTSRPSDFLQPLDPSILTQPVWINVFLTPGASFLTSAPVTPLPTNTPLATNTAIPTTVISPTITGIIPSPTNTVIYFPPPPTNTPKPPSTNTPVPPALSADLSITKDDGVTTYTPGGSLTYTIVVSNTSGPNAVTGATVTDTFPASMTNITWICAPTGSASCTANGTGNINDTINLAVGSSVTYTVDVDILGSTTGDLTNTATVSVPAGATDPISTNNSATDTDTFVLSTDLQILKTDGVTTYTPGNQVIYVIGVINAGPNDVTGALVTDIFPEQITSVSWTCTPLLGASCSTPNGSGDIVNHSIDLPVGSSVAYVATADTHASSVGNLVNTASVSVPAGYNDINPADNTSTDTDTPTGSVGPGINIGGPDGSDYNPGPNNPVTILFSPAVTADGTSTPDFVYYEVLANPTRVDMDWVIIEISADGSPGSWIPVLVWGNATSDTNTNIDLALVGGFCAGGVEEDNCPIPPANLYPYPGTGVTIDIDAIPGVTTGVEYPWMRIVGNGTDGPNIDAIQPYYP